MDKFFFQEEKWHSIYNLGNSRPKKFKIKTVLGKMFNTYMQKFIF